MRHAGHFREPVRGRKWTDILGKLLKVVATKSCKRVMESCPFRVLIGLTNPHSAACSPTVWHTACHLATHGTDALSGIAVLCHTSDQILTIWQRNLLNQSPDGGSPAHCLCKGQGRRCQLLFHTLLLPWCPYPSSRAVLSQRGGTEQKSGHALFLMQTVLISYD